MRDVIDALRQIEKALPSLRGCHYCESRHVFSQPDCPIAVLTAALPRLEMAEALLRKIIEKSKPGPPPYNDMCYSCGEGVGRCDPTCWARRAQEALGIAEPGSKAADVEEFVREVHRRRDLDVSAEDVQASVTPTCPCGATVPLRICPGCGAILCEVCRDDPCPEHGGR